MRSLMRTGFLFLLAFALAACSAGGGGSTYSISGIVRGVDGIGIEGVKLSITGGTTMAVVSGEGGRWTASGLQGEVVVTPTGVGIEFVPPSVRLSPRSTDEVAFTAHFNPVESHAVYAGGHVSAWLEEKAVSPRYIRNYRFVLRFENPGPEDGRVMVWAYIHGSHAGTWTTDVPVGKETRVEITQAFFSDDINDNIFHDGFEVIIEGANNVPPDKLVEVEFRGWPE